LKGRILAVDDEPTILEVVRLNLEAEGYEVVVAGDAAGALAALAERPCVLAILDVMLPDLDGFELARRVRDRSDIPIIMLSARDTDVDFSPLELVARVKAHLRRYGSTGASDLGNAIDVGPLHLDIACRRVLVGEVEAELTAKEFDILHMLAEHPGRVYTKAQIYETVWDEEPFGDLSTVQVHIRRLRTKIEAHPDRPDLLTTVWGIGYRLEEPSDA